MSKLTRCRMGSVGFLDAGETLLYTLLAAGHERQESTRYRWDGSTRNDGKLVLLQYTLAGRGQLECHNTVLEPGPGDLMLLEIPGAHRYSLPADSPSWEFVYMLVHQRNILPLWRDLCGRTGELLDLGDNHPVSMLLCTTVARLLESPPPGVWERSALVYAIFMKLLETVLVRPKASLPAGIQRVIDTVDRDPAALASPTEMAAVACQSRYHFQRSFHRLIGQTPLEYLSRQRIAKALRLLQEGRHEVAAVAKACGYASSGYFIKVFRRYTGMTPGAFRAGSALPAMDGLRWHH